MLYQGCALPTAMYFKLKIKNQALWITVPWCNVFDRSIIWILYEQVSHCQKWEMFQLLSSLTKRTADALDKVTILSSSKCGRNNCSIHRECSNKKHSKVPKVGTIKEPLINVKVLPTGDSIILLHPII